MDSSNKYGFERKNDVAAVVGFAVQSRLYAPWNNPKIDLWGLNEELAWGEWLNKKDPNQRWWKATEENITGWYQLHGESTFSRAENHNDPEHYAWLKKKHPFPIFMQEEFKQVPSSVRFPIEDIQKEFRTPEGKIYFTSSISYILGHLYLLGYKRIEIYGFEMASNTEYAFQRPNASWMAGRLRARGIDIYTPPMSTFLSGKVYAFEDNWVGWNQDMEVNQTKIISDQNKLNAEIDRKRGMYAAIMDTANKHAQTSVDLRGMADKLSDEISNSVTKSTILTGRYDGLKFAGRLHDAFRNLDGSPDVVEVKPMVEDAINVESKTSVVEVK
jgi:hypothetical protein